MESWAASVGSQTSLNAGCDAYEKSKQNDIFEKRVILHLWSISEFTASIRQTLGSGRLIQAPLLNR